MPDEITTRDVFRRALARTDVDQMTDGVLASFAERPEFQSIRPPDDVLRAWIRWNFDLVVRWSLDGQAPTEEELEAFRHLARISASDGTAADTIPANYRRAARYAWNELLAGATEQERSDLLYGVDALFEFVDRVSRAFSEAYDEALRLGGVSAQERSAQELLDALTSGTPLAGDQQRLAEQLGLNLQGDLLPFVFLSPGSPASHYSEIAQRLRSSHVLAVARGRHVTAVANRVVPARQADPDGKGVLAQGTSTSTEDLAAAFAELRALASVALERGRTGDVSADDYLPEVLLKQSPRITSRLHRRVYQHLDAELTRTLNCLVSNDFDRARTAAELPVHRNTLSNRLARIAVLADIDLDSAGGTSLVWLAWRHHCDQTQKYIP